jgi:hypothetical protein
MANFENPEPVPSASQLAVLPFLAAMEGHLSASDVAKLRLTVHRVMTREGREYLQQVCSYLPMTDESKGTGGRLFAVDTGIMGASYEQKKLLRTKHFDTDGQLEKALREEVALGKVSKQKSWISIPFLGPDDQVVLVLYADCNSRNFFADDVRVKQMVAMSHGFCRLHDYLQNSPFTSLRNFPLQAGDPHRNHPSVYGVQEPFEVDLPRFHDLTSFNYEAAAA